MEYAAEVVLIFEAYLAGNHTNRITRLQEKVLGLKHAISVEIIPGRDIQLAVEDAAKIIFANVTLRHNLFEDVGQRAARVRFG